eukprot:TRINITY_DN28364_c0_g2_i2.p1 TRINITY_DN28364_c0_g2~~TRINITY_DN28364_c0_g2_i2.p1  ORF type:complete len:618 (-),score=76.66 TRINITY_DN28364_c0_g2_i2:175-2028(-)
MRSERLLGALVLLLRCLQGDSAGDAASDAAAAVVGISGRSGNWIDSLCFKFRNGSEVTYHNKLENDGGSGGHRQGPWTLKDDEIIVNVTQWMRPGYWFNSHGLGDCLQMQTAVNGDESKTIVFEGNQIGPEHVSTSYTAPDGEQIVGLHFDGQRLISVDFAPFIAGCNMFNILLAMTMHNESAPVSTDCQKRLAVGATCAASCINAHANDEKAFEVFSCLAPGAAPRGQLPVCTGAQVTLVTASAMLAVIAALAAAVSGAYGGGRDVQNASIEDSGGEVPRKLSMSGVWLDVTGGDVFHMEANALGATAGVGRVRLLARQVLSLLFDLPLSSDERQLAMIVLRPGLLGFSWQPERDAVAVILNSVGSSEQASAPWWHCRGTREPAFRCAYSARSHVPHLVQTEEQSGAALEFYIPGFAVASRCGFVWRPWRLRIRDTLYRYRPCTHACSSGPTSRMSDTRLHSTEWLSGDVASRRRPQVDAWSPLAGSAAGSAVWHCFIGFILYLRQRGQECAGRSLAALRGHHSGRQPLLRAALCGLLLGSRAYVDRHACHGSRCCLLLVGGSSAAASGEDLVEPCERALRRGDRHRDAPGAKSRGCEEGGSLHQRTGSLGHSRPS